MAASQFIALLESRGLLDPEIISELRRQVEQSKGRLTPEAIAKLLVENGQLTRFQATKLVTEVNESLGSQKPDPTAALRGGRPIEPEPKDNDSVEDLLAELKPKTPAKPAQVPVVEEVVEAVEVVEVAEEVAPTSSKSTKKKRKPQVEIDLAVDELPRRVVRPTTVNKKNAWESNRIFGSAIALLLLIVVFVPLLFWLFKEGADSAWTRAEDYYKQRDYEKAAKAFETFSNNHSGDVRASQARVLVGLSKIREKAEKAIDPSEGLKACQELLPTISGESALAEMRGDTTDTLLRIAEKFVEKMESSSNVTDRKSLVDKMSQQMEFILDPRFVGTQERTQNELRIRRIEEDQSRIKREILRGEELASTIAAMTKALEAKDVGQAYELRRTLIRKYPQLQSDSKINELLDGATKEQQSLVVAATSRPNVISDIEKQDAFPTALLVSRRGPAVEAENGSVFFMTVKGSLVAMYAGNGKVAWRHHLGSGWNGDAKRLSPTGDSDVLIHIPDKGILRRLSSLDGTVVWEVQFTGRLVPPSVDGDDIFVSTSQGEIFCLDALTGQSRWGKKLPQPTEVAAGGALTKRRRYVLGNHSNLYVLSRAGGQCEEVEYIGHSPSSIAVPPIWILNHLILFENDGPDYCTMRVYSTNDDGLDLKPAQNPVTLRGHVTVEPQIEGRRVTVATNLGEVAILDVDRDNPKNKVFKLVNLIENETAPKTTWPLSVGSDLWLASTRLIYYQVQVTSQKLNRQWLNEDGDQFTGRPQKVDDVVVTSRYVRGNLGVRVSAIKPTTGEPVWETDIGVPIASIAADPKGITAITTQGAVFALNGASFEEKKAVDAIENLARNQRTMLFSNPIPLKDSRIALLNQSKGNQLLVVDASKRAAGLSRMMAMDLGDAYPIGEAIGVGGGFLVFPLDNGQLVMLDPEKGKLVGAPFQPAIQAGERPVWLNPVVLADKQTLLAADQKRNLYKLNAARQLRLVTSVPLDRALKGRLGLIKETLVAVSVASGSDQIEFYDSNELKKLGEVPLEGRVVWGPYAFDTPESSLVLVHSDIDGLMAFNEQGKKLWSQSMDKRVLVGKPTVLDSDVLLATYNGELLRVSRSDGVIVASTDIRETIYGAPLVLPNGMLVPGDEGVILTAPVPVTGSGNSGARQ
jgi:outer membrane protein assembly factor BamB